MKLEYRLDDPNEIVNLFENSIIAMERDNIFQWDEIYPTK